MIHRGWFGLILTSTFSTHATLKQKAAWYNGSHALLEGSAYLYIMDFQMKWVRCEVDSNIRLVALKLHKRLCRTAAEPRVKFQIEFRDFANLGRYLGKLSWKIINF